MLKQSDEEREGDTNTWVVAYVNYKSGEEKFFLAQRWDELYHDMAEVLQDDWDPELLGGDPPEDDTELVQKYFSHQSNLLDGDWFRASEVNV